MAVGVTIALWISNIVSKNVVKEKLADTSLFFYAWALSTQTN
jgi:hypothetical protein